jgi:hypothetical protein
MDRTLEVVVLPVSDMADPLPSTDADRGGDPNGRNENDEEMARWVRCTST